MYRSVRAGFSRALFASFEIINLIRVLAFASAAVGTTACREPVTVCAPIRIFAIQLTVCDSLTGTFVASGSAVTASRQGGESSTVVADSDPKVDSLPIEIGDQGGTYDLVLRKAGYADWIKNGFVVPSEGCHPVPTALQAMLRKV